MERIWLWLKQKTIAKAIEALLKAGDDEHDLARVSSGVQANEHRAEAEEFHAAKADLWTAQHNTEQSAMRNCSNDSVYGNSAPVQSVRGATQTVNITEKALAIIAFGFGIAAFMVSLWAFEKASFTESTAVRELKQVQIQLMYTNALMIREGLVKPGDMVYGPEGNLEYNGKSFKPK